jgi:hypothetical protein
LLIPQKPFLALLQIILGFLILAKKFRATYLLLPALLVLVVQMFATPGLAQSGQNILRNGDFSNGLTSWTPGVLKPSSFAGYPKWGTSNSTFFDLKHYAYLDVAGGAATYLESDPFILPGKLGGWTLNSTYWGALSPTLMQIQLKTQMGIYTLDSFETPKIALGDHPATKLYLIPSNFTGQNIAVRFTCADIPPYHADAVFCMFGRTALIPPPAPPAVNSVAVLIVVGMGLGLAAVGVALAHSASSSASSNAQGEAKPGFHFPPFLTSLFLALVGYLSKRACCVCAGICNHTGPHSFCPVHDPRTFHSRMQLVYTVYCRFCGRKLEEHESPCLGPVIEENSRGRPNIERELGSR